jgi:membrane protein implicated in regulation of membrane protease activity
MLTLTYVALAILGCGYVVVSMLLGHFFDGGADSGAAHAHAETGSYGIDGAGHGSASAGGLGHAVLHFPFFSPLAVATLAACVGGLGLITRMGLGLSDRVSLALSVPGAILLTYAVLSAVRQLVRMASGTSSIRAEDLAGVPAEILTPIPEGGLGEAAAFVGGQRFAAPARADDGRAVARGVPVRVVRLSGGTLVVAPDAPAGP